MTGFMNQDGSALVGGLTASGSGQAFQLDAQGNLMNQAWMLEQQMLGKGYTATTGLLNVAAGNYPLSIFNPVNSGKSILLYALHASSGTAAVNSITVFVEIMSANPAYASAAIITPSKLGASASAIAASCTFAATSQTLVTPYSLVEVSGGPIELLLNGNIIVLPNGLAMGVSVFVQTYASGFSSISAKWLEF